MTCYLSLVLLISVTSSVCMWLHAYAYGLGGCMKGIDCKVPTGCKVSTGRLHPPEDIARWIGPKTWWRIALLTHSTSFTCMWQRPRETVVEVAWLKADECAWLKADECAWLKADESWMKADECAWGGMCHSDDTLPCVMTLTKWLATQDSVAPQWRQRDAWHPPLTCPAGISGTPVLSCSCVVFVFNGCQPRGCVSAGVRLVSCFQVPSIHILCVYICMHVYMYVYVCVYIFTHDSCREIGNMELCTNLYKSIYICTWVNICIYAWVYIHIHTYMHKYMYICIHIYINIYIDIDIYIYIYIFIQYIYIYIYIWIYIYTYTYI